MTNTIYVKAFDLFPSLMLYPVSLLSNSLFLHIDAHNIRIHVRLLDTLENVVYYKEIYFSVKMFEVLHPSPLR